MSSAAGWTLLAFGAFGAICAGTGVRRWSRQDAVAMWWFAFGLIGTELVVPMMVLGVAGGALLIGFGALDTGPGRVGLALPHPQPRRRPQRHVRHGHRADRRALIQRPGPA